MQDSVRDDFIREEIIKALKADQNFKFKHVRNELRDGECPECHRNEVFVKLDQPWRVQCRHESSCRYAESTRKLYPEITENLSKKFPATEKEPNATADAYMRFNRNFDLTVIRDMYHQSAKKLDNGFWAETIRVNLWDNTFWERIIDTEKVSANDEAKNRIVGQYAGRGWVPPGMTFEKDDTVYITEGIFKSMALLHLKDENKKQLKTIAALSSYNYPREIIEANKGNNITWLLAGDNDHAGHSNCVKQRNEIEKLGERARIIFPEVGEDWDDVFRAGRLDEKYLEESYWRGHYYIADTAQQRAFLLWVKHRRTYNVFSFKNAYWKYKISDRKEDEESAVEWGRDGKWSKYNNMLNEFLTRFNKIASAEMISNCYPQFLYLEKDESSPNSEIYYNFKVEYMSGNPPHVVSFDGSALESAASLNKALAAKGYAARFSGNQIDFDILYKGWFNRKATLVRSIGFIGYDRDSETYIFPDFGYHADRRIEMNKTGYMEAGKNKLKCGLKLIHVHKPKKIDLSWISDFQGAYHMNGLVLMSWWMGSLFAEQIRRKHQSWPFLEYTGQQGSGKSTQIEMMWKCCGRDNYEGFDPSKASHAGRSRNFQQVANLPVVLLEGDRGGEDRGARKGIFDMDELKTAYNGRGIRSMGVQKRGAETDEPPFRGAILISQNASVSGSDALLSRIVHCHCTQEHFTRETERQAQRLSTLPVEDLCGWVDKVLRHTNLLLSNFFIKYDELYQQFRSRSAGIEPRLIKCHAQVAAWGWLLPYVFGSAISQETCERLQEYIWARCEDRQKRLSKDHPIVEQFWETYEYLQENNGNESDEWKLNYSNDKEEIAIRLKQLEQRVRDRKLEFPSYDDLKRFLPGSQKYKFVEQRKVWNKTNDKTFHCWVFKVPKS